MSFKPGEKLLFCPHSTTTGHISIKYTAAEALECEKNKTKLSLGFYLQRKSAYSKYRDEKL